jgi:hypothetical protein
MLNNLLAKLTGLLPERSQPFAKHMIPGVVVVVGTAAYAVQHGIESGDWSALNGPQMEVGLVGLWVLFVSFWFTNGGLLGRFAKAIAASSTTLVTVGVHCLLTWTWDASATRIAIAGVVTSAAVFLIPNRDLFIPTADEALPPDSVADAAPAKPAIDVR